MQHDKIGSVMTTDVIRAAYGSPFKEVARLLVDHRISGLPVVDEDDRVIGVVSETDLMTHQAEPSEASKLGYRFRFAVLTPAARRRAAKATAGTGGS